LKRAFLDSNYFKKQENEAPEEQEAHQPQAQGIPLAVLSRIRFLGRRIETLKYTLIIKQPKVLAKEGDFECT